MSNINNRIVEITNIIAAFVAEIPGLNTAEIINAHPADMHDDIRAVLANPAATGLTYAGGRWYAPGVPLDNSDLYDELIVYIDESGDGVDMDSIVEMMFDDHNVNAADAVRAVLDMENRGLVEIDGYWYVYTPMNPGVHVWEPDELLHDDTDYHIMLRMISAVSGVTGVTVDGRLNNREINSWYWLVTVWDVADAMNTDVASAMRAIELCMFYESMKYVFPYGFITYNCNRESIVYAVDIRMVSAIYRGLMCPNDPPADAPAWVHGMCRGGLMPVSERPAEPAPCDHTDDCTCDTPAEPAP